ncbi:MAG: hypothetical protein QOJ67_3442 [Acidimicrobiaceae bacterium]
MTTNTTLVLGAGGTVGLAYHAGVLKALAEVAGIEAAGADLIVGTSAGAAAGAFLRSGWTSDDLWQRAIGTHPDVAELTEEERAEQQRAIFTRTWTGTADLARRGVGSSYALLRSLSPLAGPPVPGWVGRWFPAGLFSMASAEETFARDIGVEWPAQPLWLCAFDLVGRRRVVLGRDGDTELPVYKAALASCAIPGLYRPVRDGRRVLVDGGVSSTTNADLVAGRSTDQVIVVAPMAFDPRNAPNPAKQLARRRASRALSAEVKQVRASGLPVTVLRPGLEEIGLHGRNFMRMDTSEQVARLAYECAARALGRPALADHPAA